MCGKPTSEGIYLLKCLMKRPREKQKDMYMVFIDLKNDYNRVVPKEFLWKLLEKKGVQIAYIHVIKYYQVEVCKTCGGEEILEPFQLQLYCVKICIEPLCLCSCDI